MYQILSRIVDIFFEHRGSNLDLERAGIVEEIINFVEEEDLHLEPIRISVKLKQTEWVIYSPQNPVWMFTGLNAIDFTFASFNDHTVMIDLFDEDQYNERLMGVQQFLIGRPRGIHGLLRGPAL